MRQRCKSPVNPDSVKVIKVNQQLAQSHKKPKTQQKKVSQVLSFTKDLMAQPSLKAKVALDMGVQLAKWRGFCWGNRMQECKSHPAYLHDVMQKESSGMFLHTNTHSTETWRWEVNT